MPALDFPLQSPGQPRGPASPPLPSQIAPSFDSSSRHPPGPRAPPCHPCSLCWSLRLCSPLALPIYYFTFSYKTFSKTALLKIKMQEVSHPPPLYPKRCRRSALPRGLLEISCACLGGDIPSMFSPSCLHECHVVHVYTLLRALFA